MHAAAQSLIKTGRGLAALAIVHHANQNLITNGYRERCGLDEVVGGVGCRTGYWRILELHRVYRVPLNLHVSGTLLEALAWNRPDFLDLVRRVAREGLLELVGSSYGQNIMRFFSPAHNVRQLNEQLALYQHHLGIDPRQVKVFWPPERVWDTQRLAPVLTDPKLLNGGYQYVLLDDRLLYRNEDGPASRSSYDARTERPPEDFAPYLIHGGNGLVALPLSRPLRHRIPPADTPSLQAIASVLGWLATASGEDGAELIAVYGDDLEKAAGIGGWDHRAPSGFEAFLRWVEQEPFLRPVKLSEWGARAQAMSEKVVDVGTFLEMSREFGAGEGYEKWYFDPKWDPYRSYCSTAEARIKEQAALSANEALVDLAWKQVLVSTWETAWHTPPCGAHGDPAKHGEPSPWVKAAASHSRHALVTLEVALWMSRKDGKAHASLCDIDEDGEEELILKNDMLFAVVTPTWGGRLVFLFNITGQQGKMVVGNPCDDWNWMEELNKYMEVPANHPGALTDLGFEHDRHEALISVASGSEIRATLRNTQDGSRAMGLEKVLTLASESSEIRVDYHLPIGLRALDIECGLSPDYLSLLRYGGAALKRFGSRDVWGYANNGVAAWLRLEESGAGAFEEALVREFGHGKAIRFTGRSSKFTIWVGSR